MNLEIANMLLGVLANAVRFYAIKRMVDLFFANDKCRWKHIWIAYMAVCCYTSFIYELFKTPAWNIFANLTGLLLVVSGYKAKILKKILLVLMIYILNVAVDCVIVLSFTRYVVGESINQIFGCVTSLVILLFSVFFEKTIRKVREIELPAFYKVVLCSVPVGSIVCIYYLAITELERKQTMIIICSWLLFINVILFYLYNALTQFYSEKIEKKMFEQMAEVYAYQLDMVQESQERVNALRHDMKHHIIELISMIREEENPEAIKYLEKMRKFMLNPKEHAATGNKGVDGILNYLLQDVEDSLKHVDININMLEKSYWTDFSFCVILGNLVDNAVREASKSEEKYLEINIQSKKGIVLIFIENSYSGEVTEQDNKFKSSQKMVTIHGFGIENVKRIVETNGGEMKIDYEKNRFKVKVLLYLSNNK